MPRGSRTPFTPSSEKPTGNACRTVRPSPKKGSCAHQAVDIVCRNRAAAHIGAGFDQFALETARRHRKQHRLELHAGHSLRERNRLANRNLRVGEIDHRASFHAARLNQAHSDHIDGMARPRNVPFGRQASCVQRGKRPCWCRYPVPRPAPTGGDPSHLRGLDAVEAGHALPAAFVFSALSLQQIFPRLSGLLR